MTLQDRRKDLVSKTLTDVINSLEEILKIRSIDRTIEFSFKQAGEFYLTILSAGGTVKSGILTIHKSPTPNQKIVMRGFPLLFLHQIGVICSNVLEEVKFINANFPRFTTSVIDACITNANKAVAVLSDPKYMNINITCYFEPALPPEASVAINFLDGNCKLSFSNFPNIVSGVYENIEDSTLLGALEQILRRAIKSLKFLRCESLTWETF